jgi:hypothetical protein
VSFTLISIARGPFYGHYSQLRQFLKQNYHKKLCEFIAKCSEENISAKMCTCKPKKVSKYKYCGMWFWKVPKWLWFLDEVSVKHFGTWQHWSEL